MGKISIAAISIFIVTVSILPSSMIESEKIFFFKGFDKIVHSGMYGFLMLVWIKSIGATKDNEIFKIPVYGMIYCISLGILSEILQYLTKLGRSFEILDIFANVTGIVLVIIFFKYKKLLL